MSRPTIAIVGGGPAGLMAAEYLAGSGHAVTVFERMPTFGRKFLLAGKSGLNLTHSEDYERFRTRFAEASAALAPALDGFRPATLRAWAAELGTETFVGSSGRVFPTVMKASPLLRAWLKRLENAGVRFRPRHRWTGFAQDGGLTFDNPDGPLVIRPDATLLALGGASWPRLGSDGAWVPWLSEKGVSVHPFRPANCGFDVDWTPAFAERFAGEAVKAVAVRSQGGDTQGEFVVTRNGIEGSLVYAHAAALRDRLERGETAILRLDLAPGRSREALRSAFARQPDKTSLSNRLRKGAGLTGVKAALPREALGPSPKRDPDGLAEALKDLPLRLLRPRPIEEAISSAGGVCLSHLDGNFMLQGMAGVFAAGEMLDWEAPTGGYLLTACFATGLAAAKGMEAWLADGR